MTAPERPRVLLVGAFERDNFGDLLFHLVTRSMLESSGFAVDAASVISAEVPAVPEYPVLRMHDALRTRAYAAVWVVGGEVGGVRVADALGMSLPEGERRALVEAEPAALEIVMGFASGMSPDDPAYLPDLDRYPLNSGTALVVHSVGVSNLARGLSPQALAPSLRILASAAHLTVRDQDSLDFLAREGVEAVLSPDVIHSLPHITGWTRDELDPAAGEPAVLVHINEEQLSQVGIARVTALIAELAHATGKPVRLFAAGVTHGHDNVAAYEGMVARLARQHPEVHCETVTTRSPRELVAEIAHAAMWIGTSLHGRIISEAYGVPRLSLRNDKVARYAHTWDDQFPANVSLDAMPKFALEVLSRGSELDTAPRRAELAYPRLLDVVSSLEREPR